MLRLLGRKLLHLIPVLFLVTLATTALPDLVSGSPVASILPPGSTPADLHNLEHQYGFDEPLPVRYVKWLGHALTGNLGNSIQTNQPVSDGISQQFPVTLELAVLALLMALLVAVPLGMWTAARAGGLADRAMNAVSLGLLSVPTFVSTVLLVKYLSLNLDWFPNTGWVNFTDDLGNNLNYAFLPALALALAEVPTFHRLLRGDMITTLQEDFVLTARSKGLSTRYILFRHALRPSSFSLLTVSGITLGRLIGGTAIVEYFFSLNGLGRSMVDAISAHDIPIVQGTVVVVAVGYVLVNTLVDLGYALLDPRVRAAG